MPRRCGPPPLWRRQRLPSIELDRPFVKDGTWAIWDGLTVSLERRSGVLLHPTSLPSRFGIGDLGPAAFEFVDYLNRARQSLWQVLPLGPTGFGDSPYASPSAFAGNPLLIAPEPLLADYLLTEDEL